MYTFKVMIHPNNKQETKIRRTLNKCIECQNIIYDYLDSKLKNKEKLPNCLEVRRWFTKQKEILDNETKLKRENMTNKEARDNHLDTLFYDVSNDALKQVIKDTYSSFIRCLTKKSSYPTRKKYNDYKKSFYIDPYKIEFSDKKVKIEKIANNQKINRLVLNWINLAEKNRIPTKAKYYNPRLVLEGDRFYIVVSVDDINAPKKKSYLHIDKTIGIDTNISSIVTSEEKYYQTHTKTIPYKKAYKKFKRVQRSLSRKYEVSKELKKKLRESKNYQKQRLLKNKYQRRLTHIQEAHYHNIISELIKERPKRICIEDLNVKNMKESDNKLSKYIQQVPFRKFLTLLKNRCIKNDIKIVEADKWYKSSKTCSNCGNIKKELKLNNRTYICNKCGLKINRDYNAAINLAHYNPNTN